VHFQGKLKDCQTQGIIAHVNEPRVLNVCNVEKTNEAAILAEQKRILRRLILKVEILSAEQNSRLNDQRECLQQLANFCHSALLEAQTLIILQVTTYYACVNQKLRTLLILHFAILLFPLQYCKPV
jgi:formyltetrahydrofolate hydrolase